jgi:FMN phosphatase YigB (HAD superfamily)
MISFVYFDVGGVIIKDFSQTKKWYEMLHDLGLGSSDLHIFNQFWDNIKTDIHTGKKKLDIEIQSLNQQGITVPSNYSMIQDFVSRFEQNTSLWPVMTKIKQTAKVGLLTNMYPHLLTTIINANLLPPVNWDKIIDSSVVGFEKPGVEIYKLAEIQAEVSSNQILFVDNTPKNLDIPQSLG